MKYKPNSKDKRRAKILSRQLQMKKELRKIEGQRIRFRATVKRFGRKRGWTIKEHGRKVGWQGTFPETILLTNVKAVKNPDIRNRRLWLTAGKWANELKVLDIIEFDARVDIYEKDYHGKRWGWNLKRPTKCVRIGRKQI